MTKSKPTTVLNGDRLESTLSGKAPPSLSGEFDARKWVEEWMRITRENPAIPSDKGAMLAWFAHAIMTGYDYGCNEGYRRGLSAGWEESTDSEIE